jgi:hypothetical protein
VERQRLITALATSSWAETGMSNQRGSSRATGAHYVSRTDVAALPRPGLQTIRSRRGALVEARRPVDKLRAGLEAEGFAITASRLPLRADEGPGDSDRSTRMSRSPQID